MKKIFIGKHFLVIILLVHCIRVQGQQNFFNVPTSDITDSAKLFFQQQLNINSQTSANSTFTWGLGKGWEAGFNLFGFNIDNQQRVLLPTDTGNSSPYAPCFLINLQKGFHLGEKFKLGIGTQSGVNLTRNIQNARVLTFDWVNFVYFPTHALKIVTGAYYGNQFFLGSGNSAGIMAGFELAIIEHRLHLQADWLYGNNSMGIVVPGVVVYLTKLLSLSFGWQFANPGSMNPQAFVFEFTFRKA